MTGRSPNGTDRRLVVVSNRLPVVLSRSAGEWDAQAASGGLITALAPVLRNRGGTWIGWPGTSEIDEIRDALDHAAGDAGYRLEPVRLPDDVIEGYYHGFANEIIWPLFHDLSSRANFDPAHWQAYQVANRVFAETINERTDPGDYIWIHDYHLMLVAENLRILDGARRIGFFLHIPFPAVDIFLKLPWRFQILRALLEFDTVGFQTVRDTQNFIHCVRTLMQGITISGRRSSHVIEQPGRRTRVGSFPIGIDFKSFETKASSEAVEQEIRMAHDRLPNIKMILGIDRLDYSKGLPERITAFRDALRRYTGLQGNVTLIQVVVPSREDVPEYQAQRGEIERLVGEVNGEFTQPGWAPIHYLYRSLAPVELFA
ncbi:MAG: alpha,alpha-trehalose-phosphate synthase (UDP-forming), partial [Vicinamibacterales bacterium]